MFDTDGVPAGGQHLHPHAPPAPDTESGRFKASGLAALEVIATAVVIVEASTAPVAPQRRRHSVADSALTGIDNSASRAMSSLAGRPSVVR
jgi:hypothetical protein